MHLKNPTYKEQLVYANLILKKNYIMILTLLKIALVLHVFQN